MKTKQKRNQKPAPGKAKAVVKLPYGLLGFEKFKRYQLLNDPEHAPFMWFQMVENAQRAFLLLPPDKVVPNYQPDLYDEDVHFLGLNDPSDAMILNIVTLRGPQNSTVNLKGPIVINKRTMIGKQVIPKNAAKYPVEHPLPVS